MDGERADESLHEELAREGQHDAVESHEREIPRAFAIVCGRTEVAGVGGDERVGGQEGVGEEDGAVERVGGGGVEEVAD